LPRNQGPGLAPGFIPLIGLAVKNLLCSVFLFLVDNNCILVNGNIILKYFKANLMLEVIFIEELHNILIVADIVDLNVIRGSNYI
jgi:hypothetical protein